MSTTCSSSLYGTTREKVYIVAGTEFGPLSGKRLIIYKGLYGLTTSAARYHEVMATELRAMDFRPSKVDPELWLRQTKDGLEYLALYVNDVCVWTDPSPNIGTLSMCGIITLQDHLFY